MSDHQDKHNKTVEHEKEKQHHYKKMLLYGILLVLVVLVGYVVFTDDKKMYKLTTETKKQIGVVSNSTDSTGSSGSSGSSSSSSSPANLLSPTSTSSSSMSPVVMTSQGVSLSSTSTGGASEVRRELQQLFRSYM